jgi:formate hydrogenlyase subunit 3/multisubunit Na+/H+ antiporter MnhD subunit
MSALFLVLLPLFAAFLVPNIYNINANLGRLLLPVILAITLILAIIIWWQVAANGAYSLAIGGFPVPLGIMFYVDQFALLFICLLLAISLILHYGSKHDDARLDMLMLWLVASGIGLMLSGDLFNLYVFYEIMAISSYGLVAGRGQALALAAAIRYAILGALGSSLALLGIAIVYAVTGTLNLAHLATVGPELLNTPLGLTAFVLILVGFGVKAELFGFNSWVAEVYTTTSTRVAAILGGVISKLAMVVILRLLLLIYADTEAANLLLVFGILGVLTGELAALRSSHLRHTLAYSSIAQLGLIAIAFSIANPLGVIAGTFLAVHHAIVKSALFMLAEKWGGSMFALLGAANTSLLSVILFILLVLSLIGIPPLPGFWAKLFLFDAALQAGEIYYIAIAVIIVATVIETAYFMQIVRLMFQQPTAENECEAIAKTELIPVLTLTAMLLISMLSIGWLYAGMKNIAQDSVAENYISTSAPLW